MKIMIVKGHLRTLTAFHTGSGSAEFHTDMPLAKDGEGNYYIPGTSLAGALRDYLNRASGVYEEWCDKSHVKTSESEIVKRIFGFQEKNEGNASALLVEDAPAIGEVPVSVRDHLVIIRETGGAAPGLKFDREVVQAGAIFDFRMEMQSKTDHEMKALRPYIGSLVHALKQGDIRLGGATSRGLGAVMLEQIRIFEWDLQQESEFNEYLKFLVNDQQVPANVKLPDFPVSDQLKPEPFVEIKLRCGIDGPFMIKSGAVDESRYENEAEAPDMVCLLESDSFRKDSFVIPGSSIKGAFRAHAERIIKMCRPRVDEKFWLENFKENGTIDLKKFGRYLEIRKQSSHEPPEIEACFGDADRGQGSFIFTDAYFEPNEHLTKITNHVAIDPLTGGAIDSALYSMDAIWDDKNAEFTMLLRVQRPELWQLGLLGHLLKDLHDGRIRLGFGKTRGMGRVLIKEVLQIRACIHELTGTNEVMELPLVLNEQTATYLEQLSGAFNQKMEQKEMTDV